MGQLQRRVEAEFAIPVRQQRLRFGPELREGDPERKTQLLAEAPVDGKRLDEKDLAQQPLKRLSAVDCGAPLWAETSGGGELPLHLLLRAIALQEPTRRPTRRLRRAQRRALTQLLCAHPEAALERFRWYPEGPTPRYGTLHLCLSAATPPLWHVACQLLEWAPALALRAVSPGEPALPLERAVADDQPLQVMAKVVRAQLVADRQRTMREGAVAAAAWFDTLLLDRTAASQVRSAVAL